MRLTEVAWETAEERQLFMAEATELLETLEREALSDTPAIDGLFRAAHTLKGSGGLLGLTEWVATAHRLEDALDAVRQGTRQWDAALQQLTLQTVDALRAELRGDAAPPASGPVAGLQWWTLQWDPATALPGVRAYQAWQAVAAVAAGTVSEPPAEALAEWTGSTLRLGVPAGADPEAVRAALAGWPDLIRIEAPVAAAGSPPIAETTGGNGNADNGRGPAEATIRIGVDTLERILAGLGELLLDHSQLTHRLGASLDPGTRGILEHWRRRTLEVQEVALRARMLPLNTLFRQYPRAVHDLAQQLGKQIRLETVGGDTELDRLVMDRLHEPLLHLLRNACDHGIEPPDVRQAHGKPPTGTIQLKAWPAQGKVHLLISDDGAGIDWAAVRKTAVERGWLSAEAAAQADAATLQALLFRPGVSTRSAVTAVSGRGVGLDAVQAFLDDIHGTLQLESTLGQGTRFHMELPMTLAVMSALIVDAGPWAVGLPILAVERIEAAGAAASRTVLGRAAVAGEGGPLPAFALAQLLDPQASTTPNVQVRVRDGGAQAALWVDRVAGQQEVVVKPVPWLAGRVPWLSGVALLGDGRVALMVDVRRLVPARPDQAAGGERADGVLRAGSNQMECLVFRLGDGLRYGINVYKTREVLPAAPVTPVAGQHPWVDGFLRLRGDTVPVVSLDRALGRPNPASAPLVLITEFNQTLQAFPVVEVERLIRVRWDQVEPLPPVLDPPSEGRHLVGIIDHPEWGPIQLLDFEQLLEHIRPPAFPEPTAVPTVRPGQAVWVADDSRVARAQITKALRGLPVSLRTFPDGQALWDALEALGAGAPLPACFVLDVEMPRMDGYTLTRRLKADPRTSAIPIVLHTSLSGHWHAARAGALDAEAILTKFDAARLAATVAGWLAPAEEAVS